METGTAALPAEHPNLAIVQLGLARIAAGRGDCDDANTLKNQYLPNLEAAAQHERPDVIAALTAIDSCR